MTQAEIDAMTAELEQLRRFRDDVSTAGPVQAWRTAARMWEDVALREVNKLVKVISALREMEKVARADGRIWRADQLKKIIDEAGAA